MCVVCKVETVGIAKTKAYRKGHFWTKIELHRNIELVLMDAIFVNYTFNPHILCKLFETILHAFALFCCLIKIFQMSYHTSNNNLIALHTHSHKYLFFYVTWLIWLLRDFIDFFHFSCNMCVIIIIVISRFVSISTEIRIHNPRKKKFVNTITSR